MLLKVINDSTAGQISVCNGQRETDGKQAHTAASNLPRVQFRRIDTADFAHSDGFVGEFARLFVEKRGLARALDLLACDAGRVNT